MFIRYLKSPTQNKNIMKRYADKLQDQLQNMINILDQFNTLYSATSRYGNKDVESLDAEAERLQIEFSRLMKLYIESKSGEVTRRYLDRVDRAYSPGQLDRIKRKMQTEKFPVDQEAVLNAITEKLKEKGLE
jgi:hypothetical protein